MVIALWILLALFGVLLSALMSGTETGVYCVNRVKLRVGSRSAQTLGGRLLARELQQPARVVATLLIGNNVANYLGSLGVAAVIASMSLGDAQAIVLNALVITPVLFLFGETLPKEVFRSNADRLMPVLSPMLLGLRWVLTVSLILPVVLGTVTGLGRLFGVTDAGLGATARERLATLLHEGARYGVLSESQTSLVDRVLALRGMKVRDEMTPWYRVRVIGVEWPRQRVLREVRRHMHTQYPVVDHRGAVLGVLDAADLWRFEGKSIRSLLREPVRFKPFDSVRQALLELKNGDAELAIVETNNKPVGLLSLKDLIEPITGELVAF